MSNAANAVTILQGLKAVFTNLEAGNFLTGDPAIDAQTRALLTTPLHPFLQAVFDYGSRAAQNAVMSRAQDATFTQLDSFLRAIDAQVATLQNPTATPRRVQSTLK